jgi:hypothetical protein
MWRLGHRQWRLTTTWLALSRYLYELTTVLLPRKSSLTTLLRQPKSSVTTMLRHPKSLWRPGYDIQSRQLVVSTTAKVVRLRPCYYLQWLLVTTVYCIVLCHASRRAPNSLIIGCDGSNSKGIVQPTIALHHLLPHPQSPSAVFSGTPSFSRYITDNTVHFRLFLVNSPSLAGQRPRSNSTIE